jgi:Protein of unknown function (DUF1501)
MKPASRYSGPVRLSRRQILQVGGIGLMNLTLPRLLRAAAARAADTPRADACILIFLNGGPSHIDMWDMKPDAPAEVRGEFRPIATSLPGVQLSEHLPRLATHMHRCALVRSLHHSVNNSHAAAVYCSLTGHDRGEIGGGARPTDYPAIGAVLARCRPPEQPMLPYVSMPYVTKEGVGGPPQPGFFGGWLGRTYDPLFMLRDPSAANFAMPELAQPADVSSDRFADRRGLLQHLEAQRGSSDRALRDMDAFQTRAFELLTSPASQRAFRLDQEPAALRDSYGRNIYGQSVLLARRLIEAGTRVACISWAEHANATWDTHANNFVDLKGRLLPQLDAAVSSLLTDLAERGLLERTLVAVMGEFGRSPKIGPPPPRAAAGRDHYNLWYTLMLAGGGIKPGSVYGSSDRIGARPRTCPVTPADIVATIYRCLGISKDLELHDRLQRPFQLVPWGEPIRDLLT